MLSDNGAAGSVIVTLVDIKHPLVSVISTIYVPATMLERSSVVAPFDHKYVLGLVPPLTLKFIDPVLFPKHNTLTWVAISDNGAWG